MSSEHDGVTLKRTTLGAQEEIIRASPATVALNPLELVSRIPSSSNLTIHSKTVFKLL